MDMIIALRKLCVDIMDGKDCLELQVSVVRKYAQHIGYDLTNLSEDQFCCITNLILTDVEFTFAPCKGLDQELGTMLKWFETVKDTFESNLHLVNQPNIEPQPKRLNKQRIRKLRACFYEGCGAPACDLFTLLLRYYVRDIGEDQLASICCDLIYREMLVDAVGSPTLWRYIARFVNILYNESGYWQVDNVLCDGDGMLIMEAVFDDSNLTDVSEYKKMEARILSWEKEHKLDEEDEESVLESPVIEQLNISQWIYDWTTEWMNAEVVVVADKKKSHVLSSIPFSSSKLRNDGRTKRKAIKLD
jgi:hypothetical protein